jgi:hypothetical protein
LTGNKNPVIIQGSADRSGFAKKRDTFAEYVKNIQPISVGV